MKEDVFDVQHRRAPSFEKIKHLKTASSGVTFFSEVFCMNTKNRSLTTQRMVSMAMLAAIAYLMVVVIRIPVVMFLKYEAKDVPIIIGGFLFGPFSAFLMSLVVSLVEMLTISDTGIIGFVMNVLSTCAFACTAAFIYKKKRTLRGAVIGLLAGVVLMTIAMLLWNYLITPIYMGYPRAAVAAMLPTVFLPFNLLKGGLNAALTMLVYKPVVNALRKAHLAPELPSDSPRTGKINWGVTLVAALVLVTLIALGFVLHNA